MAPGAQPATRAKNTLLPHDLIRGKVISAFRIWVKREAGSAFPKG
jgi:hypothetical protein